MKYEFINGDYSNSEIKESYEECGFSIVRNFFSSEEIGNNAKTGINTELYRFGQMLCNQFDIDTKGLTNEQLDKFFVRLVQKHPTIQPIIYDRLQLFPSLLGLANNIKVRNLSENLLKSENLGIWPRVQLRFDKYDDNYNQIDWHHDYLYNKGTKSSITFWIPLVEIEIEMGVLNIAKGSHKLLDVNFIKSEVDRRFDFTLSDQLLKSLNIVESVKYYPGDLVIMNSMTLHQGNINRVKDRARMVAIFRVQDLNQLEDIVI
jgi:phytanoyl-CoA hydroxylase